MRKADARTKNRIGGSPIEIAAPTSSRKHILSELLRRRRQIGHSLSNLGPVSRFATDDGAAARGWAMPKIVNDEAVQE